MGNSVAVELDHVAKIYPNTKGKKDVAAVVDSTFTIKPGELVTLLGPSGCGKTTTLRMIAGFELPTSGRILIGNADVTMLPPNKRNTATVFQSYGLFPHMNVGENVAYGLKLRKVEASEMKRRVADALDMVGLGELADRAPGRLSGGQQQRVALARSLIVEPEVLLLDEPLSNLDALLREQMRVEIKRIQKRLGNTTVYVTHDRVEAMSLSDRVIVMRDGIIRQMGSPSDVYENPTSKFVAGFVGKVAFFPVDLLGVEGGVAVCSHGGKKISVKCAGGDASTVSAGKKACIMARPESLRLGPAGDGLVDGTVTTNIYLGSSIESWIKTPYGEVLAQIDDPANRTVYPEGATVSISVKETLARVLPDDDN
jgi:iron(III) transport system ATP-binding protein